MLLLATCLSGMMRAYREAGSATGADWLGVGRLHLVTATMIAKDFDRTPDIEIDEYETQNGRKFPLERHINRIENAIGDE